MSHLAFAAGMLSSLLFAVATLPMLYKAWRTHDLRSYSISQIGINNIGNLLHWLYIIELPVGPIWALHGLNTLAALVMLLLYLHYVAKAQQPNRPDIALAMRTTTGSHARVQV